MFCLTTSSRLQDSSIFASLCEASIPKLPYSLEGCSNSSHHIWFPNSRKEYRRKKKKDNCTCKLSLRDTLFYCVCRYCIFYRLKVCGNPVLSKPIGAIFPTAFAHFVSLCHILVITVTFQTFLLLLHLYSNLWSVIFDVTTMTYQRLRWWLAFFSNKVFFN